MSSHKRGSTGLPLQEKVIEAYYGSREGWRAIDSLQKPYYRISGRAYAVWFNMDVFCYGVFCGAHRVAIRGLIPLIYLACLVHVTELRI